LCGNPGAEVKQSPPRGLFAFPSPPGIIPPMPLAFESESHGTIAFGFFNIDTDLLLLERRFLFADDFTALVARLAATDGPFGDRADGFRIRRPEDMGDLMQAIRGVSHAGFLGAVYRRFPFPRDPEAFHQRAEGERNRAEIDPFLARWTEREPVALAVAADGTAFLGGIRFRPEWFRELIAYVWRGGFPRWLDEVRPACVLEMRRRIEASTHPIFAGQRWETTLCR
jgi:hypothetical protein